MTSDLTIWLAFLAGLLSFLSPCVLPIVPSFLSFIGAQAGSGFKALGRTAWFVLGFSLVFAALGLIFKGGSLIAGPALPVLRLVAGSLVILFGINTIFDFIPFLRYEVRAHAKQRPASGLAAMVVGMAFGAGWTPCIGPFLAGVFGLAGTSEDLPKALGLLLVYSAGLGLPFLVSSLVLDRAQPLLRWLKRNFGLIKWISGLVLIAVGLLIIFDKFTLIASTVVRWGTQMGDFATDHPADALWLALALETLVFLVPVVATLIRRRLRSSNVSPAKPRLVALIVSLVWAAIGATCMVLEAVGILHGLVNVASWLTFAGL